MNSFAEYSVWVSGILIVLHVSFLLYILYRKTGDAMTTAFWLTLAAVFPLGGFVLFLFFGVPGRKRMEFQIAAISSRLRYRAGRQQMLTSAVEQLDRALNKFISDGSADGTDRNLMLDRLFRKPRCFPATVPNCWWTVPKPIPGCWKIFVMPRFPSVCNLLS